MKQDNEYDPKEITEYRKNKKRMKKNEKMKSIRKKKSNFEQIKRKNEKLKEEKRVLEEKIMMQQRKIDELEKRIEILEEKEKMIEKRLGYEKIYELLEKNPKNYKLLTNLESFEFHQMCDKIENYYENLNKFGEIIKIETKKKNLSVKFSLLITLFWLKHYPIDLLMNFLFEMFPIKIKRIIRKILICIIKFYDFVIYWPSDEEFDEMKVFFNSNFF